MLKLKKIHILGFKSFCDRTELTVAGTGIAVVVGPNGCGKSNILDGVSWVLGEQSAKTLRGTHMQDVIFAGTRDRKPLNSRKRMPRSNRRNTQPTRKHRMRTHHTRPQNTRRAMTRRKRKHQSNYGNTKDACGKPQWPSSHCPPLPPV